MKKLLMVLLNLVVLSSAHAQSEYSAPHIQVKLVAEKANLSDPQARVGALFTLEKGWHIYAEEPGDVGLPTKVAWKSGLPLTFGAIQWPPHKSIQSEGLNSNVFEDSVLLPSSVARTGDAKADGSLTAQVSWVLCKDECIRGSTVLSLPVVGGALSADAVMPNAFPAQVDAAQQVKTVGSSFFFVLLSALVGGLILNLMPCVFPVLSLKVLSLLEHAHAKEGRVHSLVFSSGVMLSFLALGTLLLSLRSLGMQVGWGFQFQSPVFVAVMTLLVVGMGLNLSGLFEIGLSVQSKAGAVRTGSGYAGSFANGVLATALATPCTAPFMGSALAASLVLPLYAAFAIFLALGVGMSSPYILLAIAPQLGKFLPRPGAWMETFKQALAFPMYATAVWLLYVLATQGGPILVARCGFAVVLVAMALWIYGKWGALHRSKKSIFRARLLSGSLAVIAVYVAAVASPQGSAEASNGISSRESGSDISWESYSKQRIAQLINNKESFVIDFTAAWCLVCQVNESRVFKSEEVQRLVHEKGVKLIKADWTSKDAEITEALSQYGRNSVPFVVVYNGGAAPKQFESLISVNEFVNALQHM